MCNKNLTTQAFSFHCLMSLCCFSVGRFPPPKSITRAEICRSHFCQAEISGKFCRDFGPVFKVLGKGDPSKSLVISERDDTDLSRVNLKIDLNLSIIK